MTRLTKEFFSSGEVLYWDHTRNGAPCPISRKVTETFRSQGVKTVVPKGAGDGRETDLSGLQRVPRSAYVLFEKKDESHVIRQLLENGVQQILFHPMMAPSKEALLACEKRGVETIVACPRMVLGDGMCKIHALILNR